MVGSVVMRDDYQRPPTFFFFAGPSCFLPAFVRKAVPPALCCTFAHSQVASPSLPVARPNSAINPLDCSPYMLEKPVSRIRNFEPIKKTLQPLQLTPGLSPAAQLYQV